MHEEVETARGSSDVAVVAGVSSGGVAGSSAEEGQPVVEDVAAYVAAQLSDGEARQQHCKQCESEMLAVKLLKVSGSCGWGGTCGQVCSNPCAASVFVLQKWRVVHPEADQDAG